MDLRLSEIYTNLNNYDFEIHGAYKMDKNEAKKFMEWYEENKDKTPNYFGMTVDAERRIMENCIILLQETINDLFGWDRDSGSWENFCKEYGIDWDGESSPSDYLLKISDEKLFISLISRGTSKAGMASAMEELRKIGKILRTEEENADATNQEEVV